MKGADLNGIKLVDCAIKEAKVNLSETPLLSLFRNSELFPSFPSLSTFNKVLEI